MKQLFRILLKVILRLYPIERGKYTILTKYYFPYLLPPKGTRKISTLKYKIKMDLDLNEYLQSYLYFFGSYELPTLKLIRRLLKSSYTVFDIGANVGYTSLIFAKFIGDTGKIYGFEPEIKNYDTFVKNINLNKLINVYPQKFAVADDNKTIKLYLSKNENDGIHSTLLHTDTLSENYEEVDAIKIDDFVQKNNIDIINFVKIDVEGAEIDVIRGMKKVMKELKPIIILELVASLQKLKNLTTSEFKKILFNEYDYYPYIITDKGYLKKVDLDSEHESDNVVFIHREKIYLYDEIMM
jgi:FkbM family methyltransferase